MDIHLGTAAYDIRFERQKASQDIAAIEAEWGAAISRIQAKAGGIGFGGGGGGNGSAHNGSVAGGGQPVTQGNGTGNGVSRASAAVNGAANQNDLLAQAAKNPMMRAAYFSANQSTIAPSMAAQLGVTPQELAHAMTGGGGGASTVIRNANNQQAKQTQFYSAQGERKPTGTGYNLDSLDDSIPGQMRRTHEGLHADTSAANRADMVRAKKLVANAAAASAVASFIIQGVSNLLGAQNQTGNQIQAAGNDPLRVQIAQIRGRIGVASSIPLIGGTVGGFAEEFYGGSLRHAEQQISERDYGINLRARERSTSAELKGVGASGMSALPAASRLIGIKTGRETALAEMAARQEQEWYKLHPRTHEEAFNSLTDKEREEYNKLSPYDNSRHQYIENKRSVYNAGMYARQARQNKAESDLIYSKSKEETYSARSALYLQNTDAYGSLQQKMLANQLRPAAGYASGVLATAIPHAEEETRQIDKARKAGLSDYDIGELEKSRNLGLKNARADVEGERMRTLVNIYGGRPEEIGGFQSVEARRDISPETNQQAFGEYTRAIEKLTEAIEKMNQGRN